MLDFGKILELGGLGVALLVIAGLVDLVRKKYRQSENGNRRRPVVMDCQNRRDFDSSLKHLEETISRESELREAHIEATRAFAPIAQRIDSGVERLLEQVKPGARAEKVREESRDILIRLEAGQEANNTLMRELIGIVREGNGKT